MLIYYTLKSKDSFSTLDELAVAGARYGIFSLARLRKKACPDLEHFPYCIRIFTENLLRNEGRGAVEAGHVQALLGLNARRRGGEIPFIPGRVLLQDFTGVPLLADLAAMRDAAIRLGVSPALANPVIPSDLVIDHSIEAGSHASASASTENAAAEWRRNRERYSFIRWGQRAIGNFRVVPPSSGIIHQLNVEFLASVVARRGLGGRTFAFPDTVLGCDSHTTTVNALGVAGWGVGGIEAEAAMLGIPVSMPFPEVVGVRLKGRPAGGVFAADLALALTQSLRRAGVVGKFVEFCGPGLKSLGTPDRATICLLYTSDAADE